MKSHTLYNYAQTQNFRRRLYRKLRAETKSHLYQSFGESGIPQGDYDSVDRLRKALRGELSDAGGYTATGGGSITTPINLPDTNTSRTYDLDGLGNWKESTFVPVAGTETTDLRQHNKLNEITSRQVDDDAKVLFAYDKNGNLTDNGTLELSYDTFNRLIQVKRKSDDATIGEYTYDALNRRVSKTISNEGLTGDVPNGTTNYFYQNWQVIEERDGSDAATKQYVWGQYIDECIQLKTLTTTGPQGLAAGDYYPLQDLLYRTTALTDSSGDIVEAYDYDAYGNTLIFSAAGTGSNWWADDAAQANYGACDVLYCGYRYDPESKMYQVRNREYYPNLGRWLQRDPIGFDGGDWNLYGYVKENSSILVDPFGNLSCCDKILSNCLSEANSDYEECVAHCRRENHKAAGSIGIICTYVGIMGTVESLSVCAVGGTSARIPLALWCVHECACSLKVQTSSCNCANYWCQVHRKSKTSTFEISKAWCFTPNSCAL